MAVRQKIAENFAQIAKTLGKERVSTHLRGFFLELLRDEDTFIRNEMMHNLSEVLVLFNCSVEAERDDTYSVILSTLVDIQLSFGLKWRYNMMVIRWYYRMAFSSSLTSLVNS